MKNFLFTSESVTEGHPDKLCDCVSDAVLDALLEGDPMSRVACETTAAPGVITIMGEITSKADIDYEKIVRKTICDIGYDNDECGYNGNKVEFINRVHNQSADIALGVDKSLEAKNGEITDKYDIGAGDQGIMFGFACNETPELMPLPISLAHKLSKRLAWIRKNNPDTFLMPDGKSQVSVSYIDGKPVHADAIVISSQHSERVDIEQIRTYIKNNVILPIVDPSLIDEKTKIFINPTGRFVIGGPVGDTGLTGRKIIVDTYGGYSRHGGGAFSGKDPTKVDRSAAYMCRYLAKNVVKSGVADKCEIQLGYAIGVARPVSLLVETFGTAKVDEGKISKALTELVDLRPAAIIDRLELRRPVYLSHAAYGHMGREDLGSTWEKTDIANEIYNICK